MTMETMFHELNGVLPDYLTDRRSVRRGLLEEVGDVLEQRGRAVGMASTPTTGGRRMVEISAPH